MPDNGRIAGGRLCEGMVHVEGGVSVRWRGGGDGVCLKGECTISLQAHPLPG